MKKLLAFVLCLTLGLPLPLLAQTFPPLSVSGPEIPGNNYDDDGDGETDEIPATSIVVDANAAGNYHWHFRNCEKTTFANVADATFPDSFRVEKPAGSTIIEGEVVCYIPNLPAATYTLHIQYSTPSGTKAIWPGVNKSLRYQMKPEEASILPFITTPQWQTLVYAGTAANYYAGQNGGDLVSFVWPGGSFAIAFKSDEVRLACGYLSTGASPVRTCPGETGTPLIADYEFYELGKVASVPTAYNSAAFDNAKIMAFNGTESGTVCGGTLIVKGLWQDAATDRRFFSIVCNDTSAVTVNTANDFAPGANEDQFDFRHRANLSAVLDTDTYMLVANLQPVYSDADWSGTNNARNFATNLNTTVVRNITGSGWNMFIASDMGTNITPDTFGLCQAILIDRDADATTSTKYLKGSSSAMSEWAVCKWLSTAVPVSADTTAPVVSAPAIPAGTVQQTSFIMTANTNEDGTCRVHWGTSAGVYTASGNGVPSVNGVCTATAGGLLPGTTYYAEVRVEDAAGLIGDSTEVSTKTAGSAAVTTCTKYAGPTAQGAADGSSDANRYLLNGFWTSGHAVPDAVLCLASGTYKGTPSMITPPANLSGNKLAPITIKASTDGDVLLDGEGTKRPVSLVTKNSWWVIEGINARNSNVSVIGIGGESHFNIIRRVCAWDTLPTINNHVWSITGGNDNLLEDVCGFGIGRKIFSIAQSSTFGHRNTIRRAWASWTKTDSTGGPNDTYNMAYSSGNVHRLENVIATWKLALADDWASSCCRYLLSIKERGNGHEVLGSLFYTRNGDNAVVVGSHIVKAAEASLERADFGILLKDIVLYSQPTGTFPLNLQNQSSGQPCLACVLTNSTEIGGANSIVQSQFQVTNRIDLASTASLNAGNNPFQTGAGSGARMCFRYVDGQLTTQKLWPWPMDSRINAALVLDGKDPDDYFGAGLNFTGWVESEFGTIPSGCKA